MTSVLTSWRPPAGVDRAINGWFDAPQRAVWIFLGLFVAVWTSFQVVSYAPIALHPDLVEAFAWSRYLAPGYKHPPLTALVVAAWFSVFPPTDWAFHLLAMVNAAVALFAIDLIARRYVDGDKRLLVLLLLLLTPFYQFHAQRFSTNQTLLSTWPIATYCFLRSFQTRTLLWSIAAGIAAAVAMLGKYYSVFLVAGFVVAALVHARRAEYLRSSAPWVAAAAGAFVLAPHVYWLVTEGAQTIDYAYAVHSATSLAELLWRMVTYLAGAVGYVILPIVAYLIIVRPDGRLLTETLWPTDPDRRMLVVLLAALVLLPVPLSPAIGIQITPLWAMSAWFLLPIILLAPVEAKVARLDAVRLAIAVLCISLATLLAAPAVAWARFTQEQAKSQRAHYADVSLEMTQAWRRTTQQPLTIVTGDFNFANAVTFYSPDHPQHWTASAPHWTPWISEQQRTREGWAAICPVDDGGCEQHARQLAGDARVVRLEHEHSASFLGHRGPPVRFVFLLVPPRRQARTE
jgi:4-amino-4-deoxy-L-arabinose transferase-like glycosyltransferase